MEQQIDFLNIGNTFSALLKWIFLVGVPFGWLLLFVYFRSGSGHIILERLWRIFSKGTKITDAKIREFNQEQSDISNFKFMHRVNVERISDAHRLIAWIEENKLTIRKVAAARHWIDTKKDSFISEPKKTILTFCATILVASYFSTMISIALTINIAALITAKIGTGWAKKMQKKF